MDNEMAKKKTGTREWAEKNINIVTGCEQGCNYAPKSNETKPSEAGCDFGRGHGLSSVRTSTAAPTAARGGD